MWASVGVVSLSARHGAVGVAIGTVCGVATVVALAIEFLYHRIKERPRRTMPRWVMVIGIPVAGSLLIAASRATWLVTEVVGAVMIALGLFVAVVGGVAWFKGYIS